MEKLKEGTRFEMIPHTAVLDNRLSDKSLRLLMVLWAKTNRETGSCHYSTDTLCKLCGFSSKQTIQRAQKELVDAGWLEVKRGGVYGGRKQTNTYTILPNNPVEEDNRRDNFMEKKEPTQEPTPAQEEQVSPYRRKLHKTVKQSEKTDKKHYSDKRKNYYKTLKTYAESLEIADAWRNEILEWVNRVLDSDETVMDSHSPKDLFMLGTRKFSNSELRWTE